MTIMMFDDGNAKYVEKCGCDIGAYCWVIFGRLKAQKHLLHNLSTTCISFQALLWLSDLGLFRLRGFAHAYNLCSEHSGFMWHVHWGALLFFFFLSICLLVCVLPPFLTSSFTQRMVEEDLKTNIWITLRWSFGSGRTQASSGLIGIRGSISLTNLSIVPKPTGGQVLAVTSYRAMEIWLLFRFSLGTVTCCCIFFCSLDCGAFLTKHIGNTCCEVLAIAIWSFSGVRMCTPGKPPRAQYATPGVSG